MAIFFLALFIGLPLIEIYFLIEVGSVIGAGSTIAICILTALLGTAMLRIQGIGTMQRARQQLEQKILPEQELFGGLFLLIAGLFLLTPGFLTDCLGFLLLIPPLRFKLAQWALSRLAVKAKRGQWREDSIIEGDFEDITEGKARNSQRDDNTDKRLGR